MLPPEPLKAGAVTPPIEVKTQEAAGLIAVAARQAVLEAAGAPVPSDPKQLPQTVLWQDGADALLVEVGAIKVNFAAGSVTVATPVRCDQLPEAHGVVEVDLLFGLPDRPTGLLAAAADRADRPWSFAVGATHSRPSPGRRCSTASAASPPRRAAIMTALR